MLPLVSKQRVSRALPAGRDDGRGAEGRCPEGPRRACALGPWRPRAWGRRSSAVVSARIRRSCLLVRAAAASEPFLACRDVGLVRVSLCGPSLPPPLSDVSPHEGF